MGAGTDAATREAVSIRGAMKVGIGSRPGIPATELVAPAAPRAPNVAEAVGRMLSLTELGHG